MAPDVCRMTSMDVMAYHPVGFTELSRRAGRPVLVAAFTDAAAIGVTLTDAAFTRAAFTRAALVGWVPRIQSAVR
jgi:hypothetical protein